jgi:hypothetical protein
MKVLYKGFNIDVAKSKSMAGYKLTYYSIFRKSDGWELTSGYSDDNDTVRTWIKMMKGRVDGFLDDPSEEMHETPDDEGYYDILAEHRLENQKTQGLQ